jgi:hypothetical protein
LESVKPVFQALCKGFGIIYHKDKEWKKENNIESYKQKPDYFIRVESGERKSSRS